MEVPFLDLKCSYMEIQAELENEILASFRSGQYIGGDQVERFENEFAKFVGAKYCVSVGNGLDALVLSLLAAGIGQDDQVIVPAHTFIATWLAVSKVGASLIPVEVDPDTYNIDPSKIEEVISKKTKAIIPVHLYGHPFALDEILNLAEKYNLAVIEDAAQAHGAEYKGVRIGCHSNFVAWSFYPGKNLGALGDGGAITTNDKRYADHLRCLRNYGSSKKYIHLELGTNTRLDPVQASILSVKLKYLSSWNKRRRQIADTYLRELADLPIKLPFVSEDILHAWHLFCVQVEARSELKRYLDSVEVETLVHYPIPPFRQAAYSDMRISKDSFIKTEKICESIISLPIGPSLSDVQLERVIASLRTFYKK